MPIILLKQALGRGGLPTTFFFHNTMDQIFVHIGQPCTGHMLTSLKPIAVMFHISCLTVF